MWQLLEQLCCPRGGARESAEGPPFAPGDRNRWGPQPDDIFNLARPMEPGDSVAIRARLAPGPNQCTVNLLSDLGAGISVQLKVLFDRQVIELKHAIGMNLGEPHIIADEFDEIVVGDKASRELYAKFTLESAASVVLEGEQMYVATVPIPPERQLRFLQIVGDVEKPSAIEFRFGH